MAVQCKVFCSTGFYIDAGQNEPQYGRCRAGVTVRFFYPHEPAGSHKNGNEQYTLICIGVIPRRRFHGVPENE